ncbi:MAG: hypothetical protein V1773_08600 [bacterium]
MKKLLLIFILFSLIGCGKKETVKNTVIISEQEKIINLDINDIYAWVDFMPGGKNMGLLRLSGDFIIKNSPSYDYTKIALNKIIIMQDTVEFYIVKPLSKENPIYNKKNKKNILFSMLEGLEIEEGFSIEKSINIKIVFEQDKQKYVYPIKNIKIEKTY